MLPGEYRVKAPGALVRAGIEQSSARVTELATDAALAVEEVKLNGRGVARARVSRPVQGHCKPNPSLPTDPLRGQPRSKL